jgi:hypothetical protein
MNLPSKMEIRRLKSAFTLAEVLVSLMIAGLIFGGILTAYIQAARFADWSGYSLAAQALSVRQLEQIRSAKWDTQATPEEVDETDSILRTSLPTELDIPMSGTNAVYATSYITITPVPVTGDASARLKLVRVDTVWTYHEDLFTNTTATYLAPDR